MKNLINLTVILIVLVLTTNCKKEKSDVIENSILTVNLKSVSSDGSAKSSTTTTAGFELTAMKVSIVDLIIEENSGNDVQQEGNNSSEGNDTEQGGQQGEGSDIILNGPFVVDVLNNTANIGEVDVYPGTFKKVDFTFLNDGSPEFEGYSIILTGNYSTQDGKPIPVTLRSSFNQQIQVAIANGGISVPLNSIVNLSIVLDAQSWLNSIDMTKAIVNNNEIVIDKENNPALLTLFNHFLASQIEAEE